MTHFHASGPVRIAVFGSCVSRDLFNRKFNPHYKDLFDCVALSNQVSIMSLMSEAVDIPAEKIANLDDYGRREVERESSRSFLRELVVQRPDYLLVDMFADVHFGCFAVGGGYLTRNRWKIQKTPYFDEADKVDLVPEQDRPGYLRLWRDSTDRLLAFLAENLPNTEIILHRARNVVHSRQADGTIRPLGNERRMLAMNDWWEELDGEFAARGVSRVVDLFDDGVMSFDDHPWGAFAVHYTLDYHAAALSKLAQIALSDARSGALAASPAAAKERQARGPVGGSVRARLRHGLRLPAIRASA